MKKVLAIVLVLCMVIGLAACGGGGNTPANNTPANNTPANNTPASEIAGTYKVLVWCPAEAKALTTKQIEDFNKSNTLGIVIEATINEMSESEAGTQVLNDVSAAPDLYFFAQDQLARLVQGAGIAKLGEAASKKVKDENDKAAVAAASTGDQLYAYPLTSDNGYFMYYDKSVIKEEDLGSLEKLIEACRAAGKRFSMETDTSAWYIASFFFGTGCVSEWTTDKDGEFTDVKDTFNSPEGLIAAKGLYKLQSAKDVHVSSSQVSDFSANPASAIVVSGTWAYNDVKKILGDNMGAAELPSFNVDGKDYHMGSFNGCKLLGVKPQTDVKKGAALNQLAQFLTDYDHQTERFNELGWGPANLKAQQTDAVKNNAAQVAINAQNQYATVQGQIHGSWWDIAKVIGTDVGNSGGTDEGLQKALDNYKAAIDELFKMSDDEKNAFSVIGMYNSADGFFFTDYNNEKRSNWNEDLMMVKVSDNVWKTDKAYEMPAGCEFKCRQGKSWDVAFGNGGDNFKVETAGTYTIVLTLNGEEGVITLEK